MRGMTFEDWAEHKFENVPNADAPALIDRAKASGAKVRRVPKPGSLNYCTVIARWNAGAWARSIELKRKFLET